MESALVRFTPLYGSGSVGPLCGLLEVDRFRILLDCGWTEDANIEQLEPLRRVAPTVDAVLVSHADFDHLGALPYARRHLGLKAKILATVPVAKLGQMLMYDYYQNQRAIRDFTAFDLDDVDDAFESIVALKYSQHEEFSQGAGRSVKVTPYCAGHSVGGAVWKISLEDQEIVYAVDFNHRKERHINASVLEALEAPSLLITDARNALTKPIPRKDRDRSLVSAIVGTLQRGGNVLLPIDSVGRCMELALILDAYWAHNQINNYGVAMLHNTSYYTISFVKSHLEWLGDTVVKGFENTRTNPFDFKYIHLCNQLENLEQLPSPKVVMATSATLSCGFGRELFLKWCEDEKNTVLFTQTPPESSLGKTVLRSQGETIEVDVFERTELEGEDLEEYLQKKEAELVSKRAEQERIVAEKVEREMAELAAREEAVNEARRARLRMFRSEDETVAEIDNATIHIETTQSLIFPDSDDDEFEDEYGVRIDTEALGADGGGGGGVEAEDAPAVPDGMDVDDELVLTERPARYSSRRKKVSVRATVSYVDVEGRADGKSIEAIIGLVRPRKLVLVGGTRDAASHLAGRVRKATKHVFTPDNGEPVNISSDIFVYRALLADEMLKRFMFKRVEAYEVALCKAEAATAGLESSADVVLRPSASAAPIAPQRVGDFKLSAFRALLRERGFRADFVEGVLVVDNQVHVRRADDAGRIDITGVVGATYHSVRSLLYSQLCLLEDMD